MPHATFLGGGEDLNADIFRVVYCGGTGGFFGIGILPVSDLLDFRYFGRYY